MIGTFQALAVALLAVVPGATYQFSYERVFGAFGVSLSDRLVRFLAASAVFAALFSGPGYLVYRHVVVTGDLVRGKVAWIDIELVALAYLLIPVLMGSLAGSLHRKGNLVAVALMGDATEPRAWDFVWRQGPALVRARLKSGRWVAGLFATSSSGTGSYASGYPEDGDLFLSTRLDIDVGSGEWSTDDDGSPVPSVNGGGLLLKWSEIEYLEVVEVE